MSVSAIELSAAWPGPVILAGFIFCCVAVYQHIGKTAALALGAVVCLLFVADHRSVSLRLDENGASDSVSTLVWSDVVDARIATHVQTGSHRAAPYEDLTLVGRERNIVIEHVNELGSSDAAVLADFLGEHLPPPLGRAVRDRLPALQDGERDWQYRLWISSDAPSQGRAPN